jgi:hypothetical protein
LSPLVVEVAEGEVEAFDLAEPALGLGVGAAGEYVGADFVEPAARRGASNTGEGVDSTVDGGSFSEQSAEISADRNRIDRVRAASTVDGALMETWLQSAKVVDLRGIRGNGPFHTFLGVILHVNVDEDGTSDSFYAAGPSVNPDSVTPNFQVYKDGSIHQYLPFDWQPWAQVDGNFNYAAIETAGLPSESLTDAQLASCGVILRAYHAGMGMALQIADAPGERGLGTHRMGGAAWGGHSCPGDIRIGQRQRILTLAGGGGPTPTVPTGPHLRRPWPGYMPAGNFFGLITGPDESHGGINAAERADVMAIQRRLQGLRFAPDAPGWADGIFEQPTKNAVTLWQHAHMPGTEFFGEVWHDDWNKLFTF